MCVSACLGFVVVSGMLSVAKLKLGQEAYYEQQVARGLDDYYAGRGESPGIWAGSGSAGLGLVGVVGDEDLGTLLRGVNPASGERLRSPVRSRIITVRRLDVESGEWREEAKRHDPVSGYDLVFSCPKSVSLVHALTDDEQVRREISEAHEAVLAGGARLPGAGGVHRPPRQGRTRPGARVGVRGGGVPAPHLARAGPASAYACRGRQHDANRRRRVAGAGRRGDPEDLPACRRLPLRSPPPQRAHPAARRRVDRAGEGDGRARRRTGGSDPRLLHPAAVAARAHGGARDRGLRRLSGCGARDAGGEGAGRPAAAA